MDFMGNMKGALNLNTKQGSTVTTKGKVCNLKVKATSSHAVPMVICIGAWKHTLIWGSHYPTQMENIWFSYLWSSVIHE